MGCVCASWFRTILSQGDIGCLCIGGLYKRQYDRAIVAVHCGPKHNAVMGAEKQTRGNCEAIVATIDTMAPVTQV
jgi:hypothetical protein